MTKSKCSICGWTYDSELSLPEKNIQPNTPFESIPDEFRCPDCGAIKKWFEKQ